MTSSLYDDFESYDRFVNWDRRLAHELPFIAAQLEAAPGQRVLDAACGTGRHAIALAEQGYMVTGTDLSPAMIERARQNAAVQGVDGLRFAVAGFGKIAPQEGQPFDAVLCLGNSLPHVLSPSGLEETLADFGRLLAPDGLLLIQNRNFDAVLAQAQRWMAPMGQVDPSGKEWVFLRFYDWNEDETITFNVVTLERDAGTNWAQTVRQTTLRPWSSAQLTDALRQGGWSSITTYGDMGGHEYVMDSPNLIITARRDNNGSKRY